jgi:hypothetical protein
LKERNEREGLADIFIFTLVLCVTEFIQFYFLSLLCPCSVISNLGAGGGGSGGGVFDALFVIYCLVFYFRYDTRSVKSKQHPKRTKSPIDLLQTSERASFSDILTHYLFSLFIFSIIQYHLI